MKQVQVWRKYRISGAKYKKEDIDISYRNDSKIYDLYIKDIEGNYYELPKNEDVFLRDIKTIIWTLRTFKGIEFEYILTND